MSQIQLTDQQNNQLDHMANQIILERNKVMADKHPNESDPYITRVEVRPGKKYIKVDVGVKGCMSGNIMVDRSGNIFGIKSYGVINRKKAYGNISDISGFFWGDYSPEKIA